MFRQMDSRNSSAPEQDNLYQFEICCLNLAVEVDKKPECPYKDQLTICKPENHL